MQKIEYADANENVSEETSILMPTCHIDHVKVSDRVERLIKFHLSLHRQIDSFVADLASFCVCVSQIVQAIHFKLTPLNRIVIVKLSARNLVTSPKSISQANPFRF